MAIFVFNLVTLFLVIFLSGVKAFGDLSVFWTNMATPTNYNFWPAIFFGFSAGLLGISGFESSANFIEEQKEGVFPKTLRNMWLAVTIINPLVALAALAVLPIPEIEIAQKKAFGRRGVSRRGLVVKSVGRDQCHNRTFGCRFDFFRRFIWSDWSNDVGSMFASVFVECKSSGYSSLDYHFVFCVMYFDFIDYWRRTFGFSRSLHNFFFRRHEFVCNWKRSFETSSI